jgi:glycosidase
MLPDLNQTVPEVANYLITWIKQIVQYYGFDGIRVDTVPEVRLVNVKMIR